MDWLQSLILGAVQGVSELLPISSSAHLFLVQRLLHVPEASDRLFEVVVHLGSAGALALFYFRRLCAASFPLRTSIIPRLFFASLPAALLGFFLHAVSKSYLNDVRVMAFMLIIGGGLFLLIDAFCRNEKYTAPEHVPCGVALAVGGAQALSLVPGVSRSGATIASGIAFGMSRRAAIEFSFFLALPVLFGAGIYELYACRHLVTLDRSLFLSIGGVSAFFSSLGIISPAILLLERYGLCPFGWYRIALGTVLLFV